MKNKWLNLSHFNEKHLELVCKASLGSFTHMGNLYGANGRYHLHIDRDSPVLAVAHLDTVQKFHGFKRTKKSVQCSTLDNRLGLYIILYLLPMMGMAPDVLLTDMEESGQSTGEDFLPDKEYNWMFSFDRGGSDIVLYQYENDDMVTKLENCGGRVGWGTYSDISSMDHLGISGINFGCGMHNYHQAAAYASLRELDQNLGVFTRFWDKYQNVRLEHDPATSVDYYDRYYIRDYNKVERYSKNQTTYSRDSFDYWSNDGIEKCEICDEYSKTLEVVDDCYGMLLCRWCKDEWLNGYITSEVTVEEINEED